MTHIFCKEDPTQLYLIENAPDDPKQTYSWKSATMDEHENAIDIYRQQLKQAQESAIPIDKRWTDKVKPYCMSKSEWRAYNNNKNWTMEPFKLYSIPSDVKFNIKEERQQSKCTWCKVDCIEALGKGKCLAPKIKVAHLVEQEEKPSINYMSIVPQPDDEKFEMYMKSSKEEIARMLVNCNNALEGFLPIVSGIKEQSEVERLKEENKKLREWRGLSLSLWRRWFNGTDIDPIAKIKELESKLAEAKLILEGVSDILYSYKNGDTYKLTITKIIQFLK